MSTNLIRVAHLTVVVVFLLGGTEHVSSQTRTDHDPYTAPAENIRSARPLSPYVLESPPASSIESDDFSTSELNTSLWTFYNPGTPSTLSLAGTGTSNALLSIQVPGGATHDAWTGGNTAPRIMQSAANTDFEVEIKYESALTGAWQVQGIIVQQDPNNYVRFDFYRAPAETRIHAGTISGGTGTSRYVAAITGGNPLYMRVRRVGNQWTQTFSYNGSTWFAGASFSHAIIVSSIGPFFGSAGNPAPAFTGLVDYFFNVASPVVPEDAPPVGPWWNTAWRFRLPVEIRSNGFERTNKPAEVSVNFTQLLNAIGQSGTFEEHSIRVVETSSLGTILDTSVVFQFDRAQSYNASNNARGIITVLLGGQTAASASRYFHIYFETTTGGSFSATEFAPQVTVTDDVNHQGQASIKIETQRGTYYYHKLGGGFASLQDAQGNDWIGYNQSAGSSGEFRGIPNLGEVFHPGYTNSNSIVESDGPLKTRIRTTSIDGNWECTWDVFPDYARMTLLRKATNYWFLYEGTPGGVLDLATDYVVRASGQKTALSTSWSGDLPAPEWVYFGDGGMQRMLYLAHHEDDLQPEYYRDMDGNMTVFGFGRQDPCCTRYLSAVPQSFTFGLSDDTTFVGASRVIKGAYRDLIVHAGNMETRTVMLIPPVVSGHPQNQNVLPGQSATFAVVASGMPPVLYQWLKNGATISGATGSSYTTPPAVVSDNNAVFECVVSNTAGVVTSNPAVLTVSVPSGVPISDDFNANGLDGSIWTFVNPLNDAAVSITGAGTTNARLAITVPGGFAHDVWSTGITAPRIMQQVANTDFDVEVKFEGVMSAQYQTQGILVQQDNGNLVRVDFIRNSNRTRLFAATFVAGTPTVRKDTTIAHGNPLFMRVKRLGNQWTISFSYNGTNWLTGASFTHTLDVNSIGPFAGNAGSPAPAFTGLVDYFFNVATPIVPEDGGPTRDVVAPVITNTQAAATISSANISWTTNEPATGVVQYGLTPAYELGSVSHTGLQLSHSLSIAGLQPGTTYQYRIRSSDAANNEGVTENQTFTTQVPTPPTIAIWYGKNQSFGQLGNPVPDINILGRVSAASGVASLAYSLNNGPQVNVTIGPDSRRLARKGDFNIDIPYAMLLSGNNQVVITARDSGNVIAVDTVNVEYVAGNTWPAPYNIDWSTVTNLSDVAQPVDGLWTVASGALRTAQPGYDRFVAVGDRLWTDYEISVPVTILALDSSGFQSPSNGAGIGFVMRWPGHSNSPAIVAGRQPKTGYLPLGSIGWYTWDMQGGQRLALLNSNAQTLISDASGKRLDFNTTYMFKMRTETLPGAGVRYSLKVWNQATVEPAGWDLVGVDGPGAPASGSVLLTAHHVDAQFGNVTITPLENPTRALTVNIVGPGSVAKSPNQTAYTTGQVVTLTATPTSGWVFSAWGGDLSGSDNPKTIVMDGNRNVTATFVAEQIPPVISNVQLSVTSSHATVRWTTDKPATSSITYGLTTAYEHGSVSNSALVTNHTVILTGLLPGAVYHFKVSSADGNNNTASTGDSTFTTAAISNVVSDDFNAYGLNPALWTFVNPANDASIAMTSTTTPNAAASITVPGGTEHQPWTTGMRAPHILQLMNNADFEFEVKYLTAVQQRFQEQGIVIMQDAANFLRFEIYSDGSSTRLLAASLGGTTSNLRANNVIAGNNVAPIYMRVKRDGDQWTQSYSLNGQSWTTGVTFSYPLNSTGVALYAGNAGTPAPVFTSSVDYFFNMAAPIDPEDGGIPVDTIPPVITNVHVDMTTSSASITWLTDEPATSIVAYGLTDGYELGAEQIPGRVQQHSVTLSNLQAATQYHFRVTSADSLGNIANTQDAVFTTKDFLPTITLQPLDRIVAVGATATFTVAAEGAVFTSYQWQRNGVDIEGATGRSHTTSVVSTPDSGSEFRCRVSSAGGTVLSATAVLHVMVPPSITTQPSDRFVALGQTATFNVWFAGSFPFTFQWQKNGVDIPGANWMFYTTPAANIADSGSVFRCRVMNAVGEAYSQAARLEVALEPTIVTQPADQFVRIGEPAVFTVSVTGTPDLFYQWQRNGVDIPNAKGASYAIPAVSQSDSGATFRCKVWNWVRLITSNQATLNVIRPTPQRVTQSLQALYTFNEASGSAVYDVSGVGTPLNLTIGSTSRVTWFPGYLRINSATALVSAVNATKLIDAGKATNEVTFEAWVRPANISQGGPAHIVALAKDGSQRNFLIGQEKNRFDAIVRTSSTGTGGSVLSSANNTVSTALSHIVQTRNAAGVTRLYKDGVLMISGTIAGTFSTWASDHKLSIAAEPKGGKNWLGDLYLVAIYNRALTQEEILQNFSVGSEPASAPLALNATGGYPEEIPTEYVLHQNYPNPFNPATTIRYALPSDNLVTLKLYNILGQEVLTLVEAQQGAGVYEVRLDGNNLATGTYVYRLIAGEYTAVKKLMLVK